MEAQPLKIWLTTGSYDLPIIGSSLMQQEWFHYFMSWGGMFYDLLIPFILLYHDINNDSYLDLMVLDMTG